MAGLRLRQTVITQLNRSAVHTGLPLKAIDEIVAANKVTVSGLAIQLEESCPIGFLNGSRGRVRSSPRIWLSCRQST
jgi:hypothetical protein